jgi:hypothetical protein
MARRPLKRRQLRLTPEERAEIVRRWNAGESGPDISAAMDVDISTIRVWTMRAGCRRRVGRPRLFKRDVLPMLHANGGDYRAVAKELGMTWRQVYDRAAYERARL